ncbi:MAG: hypothetical protein IT285_13085 [Bdellovibrionales bacterium]|nr:hypothetical protein [Bdellovibrionales bacterium]
MPPFLLAAMMLTHASSVFSTDAPALTPSKVACALAREWRKQNGSKLPSPKEYQAARQKLDSLKTRYRQGADMEELTRAYDEVLRANPFLVEPESCGEGADLTAPVFDEEYAR